MVIRNSRWFMVALSVFACQPTSSSVSTGPHEGEDNINGEQAEVAVAAGATFILPTLVAGFNDFSVDSHFSYSPSLANPQTRTVTRPVSVMGWSHSLDVGGSWQYDGKLQPPPGWSAIWGDPAIAVDAASPNVVYYAQLGVSDTAWNIAFGNVNTTSGSPGMAADGFCVARSTDGGVSFSTPSCVSWALGTRRTRQPNRSDRTAIAVDGNGDVWVAQNLVVNNAAVDSVVFRSQGPWNNFVQMPHPQESVESEPWLVTDPHGEIWFSAVAGFDVHVQHWNPNASTWDQSFLVGQFCGLTLAVRDVALPSGTTLRNAHSYSLWVGESEQGTFALRAVLQLRRPDARDFLQAIQITPNSTCLVPPEWSTADRDGQQFEASLSYRRRNGNDRWWEVTYLSTERVPDDTQNFVHPEGARISTFIDQNGKVFPFMQNPVDLTPTDWFACTRNDPTASSQYWGDYFGVTQVRDATGEWWSVSAYSDSTPSPPCQTQTPYLARPLHVRSSRW